MANNKGRNNNTTKKNKAWKKRVARGELAKGAGGAICRHRPRLGRRGVEELKLNRKGFIGGRVNPKKLKKRHKQQRRQEQVEDQEQQPSLGCIDNSTDGVKMHNTDAEGGNLTEDEQARRREVDTEEANEQKPSASVPRA